jgi:hypothetical protein
MDRRLTVTVFALGALSAACSPSGPAPIAPRSALETSSAFLPPSNVSPSTAADCDRQRADARRSFVSQFGVDRMLPSVRRMSQTLDSDELATLLKLQSPASSGNTPDAVASAYADAFARAGIKTGASEDGDFERSISYAPGSLEAGGFVDVAESSPADGKDVDGIGAVYLAVSPDQSRTRVFLKKHGASGYESVSLDSYVEGQLSSGCAGVPSQLAQPEALAL